MKVVLDTNVIISGLFFTGPPYQILRAWRDGRVTLVTSEEILMEYERVGEELAVQFPTVDLGSFLALVTARSTVVRPNPLLKPVCEDPDDDKFLSCAIAGKCRMVISGDRHLLKVSGSHGVQVLRPRTFVDEHLC